MKLWILLLLLMIAAGAAGWYLAGSKSPDVYVTGSGDQVEYYTHVDDITKIAQTCRDLRKDWPGSAKLVVVYVGDESVAANACRPPQKGSR